MVVAAGPPATRSREPGQARKGAAAAVEACAGVWLAGTASLFASWVRDRPPCMGYTPPISYHPAGIPRSSHVLSGAGPQMAPQVL
jgi:hypothetical protein